MIFLVDAGRRWHFAADLAEMHRQRKATFVDRAGWNIPVVADQEIDPYDRREDTLHLLAKDEQDGAVLASARLLTTTGPHLMCDLFGAADREKMPRGCTVWEASRFCTAPGIQARDRRHGLLWEVICGVLETGLLYGIDEVIFAASRALLPLALNCGWEVRTLSPRRRGRHDDATAVAAVITVAGLRRVRQLHSVAVPVVQLHAIARTSGLAQLERPPPLDASQNLPPGHTEPLP